MQFSNGGKILFFTKKKKNEKIPRRGSIFKRSIEDYKKKQVNIGILGKLYLSHEGLLIRVVICYNNGYLRWKTIKRKKWIAFLMQKNHGSSDNYVIF